jgi:hypothetical protein
MIIVRRGSSMKEPMDIEKVRELSTRRSQKRMGITRFGFSTRVIDATIDLI